MSRASLHLENLKKRAKALQKQHAEHFVPVAPRLRAALPAWADRTDLEILQSPLSLAMAQQVVAVESGFESWALLKRSTEAMRQDDSKRSTPKPSTQALLVGVHPQIFVTDMDRSLAFYRDQLEFAVAYAYGEPPYYALVKRDSVGANLRRVDALPVDPRLRAREDWLAVTFIVREPKALFLRFKAAGLSFHQSYLEQPWGAHDFIVSDPDGNLIHFAEEVTPT